MNSASSYYRSLPNQRGTTLLELVVALAVFAILAFAGGEYLSSLVTKAKLRLTTEQLVADINYARASAGSRLSLVQLCSLSGCDDHDWSKGWQVTVNGATARQYSPPNNTLVSKNHTPYLHLDEYGFVDNAFGTTFSLCVAGMQAKVVVNQAARARIEYGQC